MAGSARVRARPMYCKRGWVGAAYHALGVGRSARRGNRSGFGNQGGALDVERAPVRSRRLSAGQSAIQRRARGRAREHRAASRRAIVREDHLEPARHRAVHRRAGGADVVLGPAGARVHGPGRPARYTAGRRGRGTGAAACSACRCTHAARRHGPAPSGRRPAASAPAAPMAGAKEYGPIKQGENLSAIAKSVAPEGVTLEQMMVEPLSQQSRRVHQQESESREGRPDTPRSGEGRRGGSCARRSEEGIPGASGRLECVSPERCRLAGNRARRRPHHGNGPDHDQGRGEGGRRAQGCREVVEGRPGWAEKGKARSTADRVRALEEEVLARDKALSEANERISQLEKTIKDMQRLAELKSPGMAAAQQKAEQAAKAKAEAQPTPPAPAPKPEVKAEAPKPEPAPAPKRRSQGGSAETRARARRRRPSRTRSQQSSRKRKKPRRRRMRRRPKRRKLRR